MRSRLTVLLAIAVTALGFVTPALASTGGTPDGDTHPNVALIISYTPEGRFRCSATLVTPTVLLTAAHCTEGVLGKVGVTFNSTIAEQPPSGFPSAADATAGYTSAELASGGMLSGVAHTHPLWDGLSSLKSLNDVGVVVLDTASALPLSPLAPLGTIDAIPSSQLRSTLFRAVGYGTEVRKPDTGPQKPIPMSYPLLRRYVDMPGQKTTSQVIQTNGNDKDPFGTGGTCFGDSGGPLYLGSNIVGVSSYVFTNNCRYLDGFQRVDTPVIRNWLVQYGVS